MKHTISKLVELYINDVESFGEELSDVEIDTLRDFAKYSIEAESDGEWIDDGLGNKFKKTALGIKINMGDNASEMNNNNPVENKTIPFTVPKQINTGPYPEPGQIWRHYKGGKYQIVAMCNHTDTNEVLVIYKSLSFGGYHARPYSEWHDRVMDKIGETTRFIHLAY